VVLGSSHTMPPEQVQGQTAGPRADVYSLGALAFRMVCGRYPFHASSPVQVLAMHAHAKVPSLSERAKQAIRVPRGLESLLQAMLAKAPEERPSAAEVSDRLAALAAVPQARWVVVEPDGEERDADGAKPPPPAPPAGRARVAWAAGIGLAIG
jgi:serine/threonine-protein kinase